MSYSVIHICGKEMLKSSSPHPAGGYYSLDLHQIYQCPQCREYLCDTDMTDLSGVPIQVHNQSEWSKQRRRERGWQ